MTKLTLNLENCTKEEKRRAIDIAICYAKTPIDKATHTIVVMVEDEKVNHLISSLLSSVTIMDQQKLENNEITPQVTYHKPSGWLIVNSDYYNGLHLEISELITTNARLQKLAESYIPIDHVCIDKEEYDKLQQKLKETEQLLIDREKMASAYKEKYEKSKALYRDLMGTLAGTIDKFPYDV